MEERVIKIPIDQIDTVDVNEILSDILSTYPKESIQEFKTTINRAKDSIKKILDIDMCALHTIITENEIRAIFPLYDTEHVNTVLLQKIVSNGGRITELDLDGGHMTVIF